MDLVKGTQCLPCGLHHEELRHWAFIPVPQALDILLEDGDEELHFRRHLGKPGGDMCRLNDERDEARPDYDVGNGHTGPVGDGAVVMDGFEEYSRPTPHRQMLRKFGNGGDDVSPG